MCWPSFDEKGRNGSEILHILNVYVGHFCSSPNVKNVMNANHKIIPRTVELP